MAGLILPSLNKIARELARRNVLDFTRYTFKTFQENWHHIVLGAFLTAFAKGLIPRGMIFMPPRHGKTEFSSRRTPAFILGRDPDQRVMGCSYGADLAGDISNDIQSIMALEEYRQVFPKAQIGGKHGKQTERMFTMADRLGYYRAAGIGGPIGGYGYGYGIIDDPIKNAKEAESKVIRDGHWNWYQSTFYPRMELPGAILLTTTRWHEDDLAGRLLTEAKSSGKDQWEVLNLPAIAEEIRHASDPRAVGEALWPDRYPLDRPDGDVGPTLNALRATRRTEWFQDPYHGHH